MIFRRQTADSIVAPITKIINKLEAHQDASFDRASRLHARADANRAKANNHEVEAARAANHAETFRKIFPTI